MNASVDLARAPAPCAEPAGNQRTGCFGEGVRKAWRRLAWWLLPLLLLAIVLSGQGTESIEAYRVGQVMSSPAITTESSTDVLAALALMTQRRIRHLPVLDGQSVRGFVSIGDLVKYRIDRIVAEAEAMRSYIQSA